MGEEEERGLSVLEGGRAISIKNLSVGQLPLAKIGFGDIHGLAAYTAGVERRKSSRPVLLWNEDAICFYSGNPSEEVTFQPELHPRVDIFFQRQEERHNWQEDKQGKRENIKVWEGDYVPVQFKKRRLIQWLRENEAIFEDNVLASIKSLRVSAKASEESQMLSLDNDDERQVRENTTDTNLPPRFSGRVPLLAWGDYMATLDFEAEVVLDRSDGRVIQLRVTNGRQVKRGLMEYMLAQLPADLPRYYGAMKIQQGGK